MARPKAKQADPDALTPKERQFVHEFLIDMNGSAAARRAGYAAKGASVQAARLLTKAKVSAEIANALEAKLKAAGAHAEQVIAEAACIAYADLRLAFDKDGQLLSIKDLPDGLAHAIASIEVEERPKRPALVKIRLWDKVAALTILARYFKLLTDKVEHSGTLRFGPDPKRMSTEDLKAEAEDLMKRLKALEKLK